MQALLDNLDRLWSGFLTTLGMSVAAAVIATILGTILAAFRVSPLPPLRALGATYVQLVRNTPLTAVFFIVIFGLPAVDVTFQNFFIAAIVALSVYTAAFVCEVVRSGINSVSTGQAEAARAIGLTFGQSLRDVVLPQAFRSVVPPLGNLWIALVKNSAIAGGGFAVADIAQLAPSLARDNPAQVLAIFGGIALAYMVITVPSGIAVGVIERRTAILR
ncbi:MAG: amino acid ABC transporter permease [Geodermatophilaceae bacterium]|nr:amino acid ABC transporter permease [Geodermatophilaceae bacterium]